MNQDPKSTLAAHGGFGPLLRLRGFQCFLWTQFLGAFNDNIYKMAVQMRAVHVAASSESSSYYLALAGAVFVIPFLLFSGYSGHLADVVSKRRVLIGVKIFEIGVMLLGVAAFFTTSITLMLAVLFLMALHSTIFSPAKYGIVPEMLPDTELSRANALLEMSTFVAIVMGTAIGGALYAKWSATPWYLGIVMTGVAVAGFLTSLGITKVPPSGSTQKFQWNPLTEVITGTRHLLADRPQWLTVVAISYFWFLGALFQMDLLLFGSEVLKVDDYRISLMVTGLAVGIGTGSMVAGKLSGNKVELGLVPLGSIFMSIFCIALWAVSHSYLMSMIMLSLLGLSSGLFIVPLNAYLQQRAENHEKGRIIATNNIWNTVGLLAASGVLALLHDRLHVRADRLILISGVATIFATVWIVRAVPEFFLRFVLWMLTHTLYRIRVTGQENLPLRGPALLVSNHVSHVDGFLITSVLQRFIRFMIWKPYYEHPAMNWFCRLAKAIPVGTTGPRDIVESFRAARRQLEQGHVVCIFAEGAITRTGNLLPFKRGVERILDGVDIPVIPVHLGGMWGSIFSYEGGRFFWKWPKRMPYPVTLSFGDPMPAHSTAHEIRQAILELGARAEECRPEKSDTLGARFVQSARKNWNRPAMADSSGRTATYGEALTGALLLARWLRKHTGERMIGLMLPPSVGGALANLGVTLAGRVAVNLNFTAGREAMAHAVERCGIQTVITSKLFLAKAKLEAPPGAVFIEEILASWSPAEKLLAWLRARLPFPIVGSARPSDLATVIFSSGSTGLPKGVMLSHYNIVSNIESMIAVFSFSERDRILGVLPFFHSFGYTVTIWLPLLARASAVYHANPTDAKIVGELADKHQCTFLLSTPTFCAAYARKVTRDQFSSLRFVLVGAEKLRESVAKAFENAFGIEMLEGYGCTEMSPVIAVNHPSYEAGRDSQPGSKPGTVGHPLPGVAVKVVDPATGEPLGPSQEGLLLVRGANRMLGYLGEAERTAEAIRDGWYSTGDIGRIDDEGFITITDRLSRFSKIGGEMVPHLRVEEAIYQIGGDFPCAVTGVPDEQRGERLVALYTRPDLSPDDLWRALSETDLPRLWLPKRENIYRVDVLPALGTGKTDLRGVRTRALELAAANRTQSA